MTAQEKLKQIIQDEDKTVDDAKIRSEDTQRQDMDAIQHSTREIEKGKRLVQIGKDMLKGPKAEANEASAKSERARGLRAEREVKKSQS